MSTLEMVSHQWDLSRNPISPIFDFNQLIALNIWLSNARTKPSFPRISFIFPTNENVRHKFKVEKIIILIIAVSTFYNIIIFEFLLLLEILHLTTYWKKYYIGNLFVWWVVKNVFTLLLVGCWPLSQGWNLWTNK